LERTDRYNDLLLSKMQIQTYMNNEMVKMNNPVARQVFSRIRDEDMTHIILLQQLLESLEGVKDPVQIIPPKG
jgi:rubrerythrin